MEISGISSGNIGKCGDYRRGSGLEQQSGAMDGSSSGLCFNCLLDKCPGPFRRFWEIFVSNNSKTYILVT